MLKGPRVLPATKEPLRRVRREARRREGATQRNGGATDGATRRGIRDAPVQPEQHRQLGAGRQARLGRVHVQFEAVLRLLIRHVGRGRVGARLGAAGRPGRGGQGLAPGRGRRGRRPAQVAHGRRSEGDAQEARGKERLPRSVHPGAHHRPVRERDGGGREVGNHAAQPPGRGRGARGGGERAERSAEGAGSALRLPHLGTGGRLWTS